MAQNVHANHRKRMRERFINSEAESFSDHELLEMLLFYPIPRKNTNDMAHSLIDEAGCLGDIFSNDADKMRKLKCVGKITVEFLESVAQLFERLRGCEALYDCKDFHDLGGFFLRKLGTCKQETVMFLLFDKSKNLCREMVFEFYNGETEGVDVKSLIEAAVCDEACYAAVAYNRPVESAHFVHDKENVAVSMDEILQSMRISLVDFYTVVDGRCDGVFAE